MKEDPLIHVLVAVIFITLLMAVAMRRLKQPHVVGYLLTGLVLGPHVLGVVDDREAIRHAGAIGVDLLLFFIGMEVEPKRLLANWRLALLGVTLQIGVSVALIGMLGWGLGWGAPRVILMGFVISISSTAVVLKLLSGWEELDTRVGQNALAILLAQDLAIIPMLIVVNLLGEGAPPSTEEIFLQVTGAVALGGMALWVTMKDKVRLPFANLITRDHETQVFGSLMIFLGLSMVSGMFGLSTAMGAFVAGMVISAGRETHWVKNSLEPFHVVLVALFFMSVGMMIDLNFVWDNIVVTLALALAVAAVNMVINAGVLRLFGYGWPESLYFGAILSQIGEFSFVIAAAGYNEGIVGDYTYQMTLALISLTLLASPFYIAWVNRMLSRRGYNIHGILCVDQDMVEKGE